MNKEVKQENPVVPFRVQLKRKIRPKMVYQKKKLLDKSKSQDCSKMVIQENAGGNECKKRKRPCDAIGVNSPALDRAKEVQANLAPEYPSLIKSMLPSHVTGGFWLGLPSKFCSLHMPKHDVMIILEDESGKKYEVKYLFQKIGLSGGWRGFSLAHRLLEGDALVFHLVTPSKFKVYIVRSEGSNEVDGALGLLKLDACTSNVVTRNSKDDNNLGPLSRDLPPENKERSGQVSHDGNLVPGSDLSENDSEDLSSEDVSGIRFSDSVIDFNNVRSIEDFVIQVNGLVINSELPRHLQAKYYDLCCSQKSFLHTNLVEGLNCRLVSGMIVETINIADAIRASKPSTSIEHMAIWDMTLKAFEALGMNVRFLCTRVNQLMNLALKSKGYNEARLQREKAIDEVRSLEAKLSEVKEKVETLSMEMEALDMSDDKLELLFQEATKAPW